MTENVRNANHEFVSADADVVVAALAIVNVNLFGFRKSYQCFSITCSKN